MIPQPFPHKQFLRFVGNKARRYGGLRTAHRHFQVWRKLQNTNLDAAYSTLALLYSADKGRIAHHPECITFHVVLIAPDGPFSSTLYSLLCNESGMGQIAWSAGALVAPIWKHRR